jgi:hypothetical protein
MIMCIVLRGSPDRRKVCMAHGFLCSQAFLNRQVSNKSSERAMNLLDDRI